MSDDYREIHIRLPLSWRTKNYVGSVFGGSIYASTDPFYMLQLIYILGKEYVVWDKAATVKFRKPIKKSVFAKFLITEALLSEIKEKVKENGSYTIELPVTLQDKEGVAYASITKTIYIADKAYYQQRKKG